MGTYDFARYRSLDKALEVASMAVENGLYSHPGTGFPRPGAGRPQRLRKAVGTVTNGGGFSPKR